MTRADLRRLRSCDRGAAAVEFAIISVVLITILVGIIDFGRTLYVKNQLSYLADQAARLVLIDPDISNAAVEADLRTKFTAGTEANLSVTITSQNVGGTDFRVLSVTYPLTLFIPYQAASLTLSVTRRVPSD